MPETPKHQGMANLVPFKKGAVPISPGRPKGQSIDKRLFEHIQTLVDWDALEALFDTPAQKRRLAMIKVMLVNKRSINYGDIVACGRIVDAMKRSESADTLIERTDGKAVQKVHEVREVKVSVSLPPGLVKRSLGDVEPPEVLDVQASEVQAAIEEDSRWRQQDGAEEAAEGQAAAQAPISPGMDIVLGQTAVPAARLPDQAQQDEDDESWGEIEDDE